MEGRAWNEAYLLRAFLQFNQSFQVRLFSRFLSTFHWERLLAAMPKCEGNLGGSFWMQRA